MRLFWLPMAVPSSLCRGSPKVPNDDNGSRRLDIIQPRSYFSSNLTVGPGIEKPTLRSLLAQLSAPVIDIMPRSLDKGPIGVKISYFMNNVG
jgi:hypothetical protein